VDPCPFNLLELRWQHTTATATTTGYFRNRFTKSTVDSGGHD
jgi:hypothetical protein